MGFRGDIGKIDELARRFEKLATPRIKAYLSEELAGVAVILARQDYDKRGGPGRNTEGGLRDSIKVLKATAKGFSVGSELVYARIQQQGGDVYPKKGKFLIFPGRGGRLVYKEHVKIPPRPYLPVGDLPPRWRNRLDQTVASIIGSTLGLGVS
jgi:phage gpG-like protein